MADDVVEQLTVTRVVDAPPAEIFEVLAQPTRHQETDPASWRWVREPVEPEPITHAGQVFAMNMYLEQVGGDYRVDNMVTAFVRPRLIAWRPGSIQDGDLHLGGWEWRYDLVPEGDGTRVTLTYDWRDTSERTRKDFGGMPPWPAGYLQESIDQLAASCEAARTSR